MVVWYAIKLAMGIRVSAEEEIEGLDIGEHGMSAYPDFATHDPSFGGVAPGPSHAMAAAAPVAKPVTVKS